MERPISEFDSARKSVTVITGVLTPFIKCRLGTESAFDAGLSSHCRNSIVAVFGISRENVSRVVKIVEVGGGRVLAGSSRRVLLN